MALKWFKSPGETPWDRFSSAFGKALRDASGEFRRAHGREVQLGSPVRMSDMPDNTVRAPIEVRGGPRSYSVAYLYIKELREDMDLRGVKAVAEAAVRAAEPYGDTPPEKPGMVDLHYP